MLHTKANYVLQYNGYKNSRAWKSEAAKISRVKYFEAAKISRVKYFSIVKYRIWIIYCFRYLDKGQKISKWKYEVVALHKIWTKSYKILLWILRTESFFIYILANATTSCFNSEISWALDFAWGSVRTFVDWHSDFLMEYFSCLFFFEKKNHIFILLCQT